MAEQKNDTIELIEDMIEQEQKTETETAHDSSASELSSIVRLRVWWIPQVPGKAFYVSVGTVAEGVKIMTTLARYDMFQFDNKIKPDYCNDGGLQMFDETDTEDGADGSWVDWRDKETGDIL